MTLLLCGPSAVDSAAADFGMQHSPKMLVRWARRHGAAAQHAPAAAGVAKKRNAGVVAIHGPLRRRDKDAMGASCA